MPKLYIRGLVKAVNAVRRGLSRPLSAERRKELRRLVEESVRQVDLILTNHRAELEDLPWISTALHRNLPPSRTLGRRAPCLSWD